MMGERAIKIRITITIKIGGGEGIDSRKERGETLTRASLWLFIPFLLERSRIKRSVVEL